MTKDKLHLQAAQIINRHAMIVDNIFDNYAPMTASEVEYRLAQHGLHWQDLERVSERCGISRPPDRWIGEDGDTMWIWTRKEKNGAD